MNHVALCCDCPLPCLRSYRRLADYPFEKNHRWFFFSQTLEVNAVLWLNGAYFHYSFQVKFIHLTPLPKWKKSRILLKLRALSQELRGIFRAKRCKIHLSALNIPLSSYAKSQHTTVLPSFSKHTLITFNLNWPNPHANTTLYLLKPHTYIAFFVT